MLCFSSTQIFYPNGPKNHEKMYPCYLLLYLKTFTVFVGQSSNFVNPNQDLNNLHKSKMIHREVIRFSKLASVVVI